MNQTDIVNTIITTINTIFKNLFVSIDNNIYSNLDNLIFINSDIINNSLIKKLLGENGKNGFLYLTDVILLGIFIFYIIRYYFSTFLDHNVEKPSQFIFKLLIFTIFINFSYFIIEFILNLNYIITDSIQSIGKSIINHNINFSELITYLNKKLSFNQTDINLFSFDGIIKSFVSIGLLELLFNYSVRYILIQVLILFTPFSFLFLMNTSTSWIFKIWLKSFISLLIIQIFIPLILIIIFTIDDQNRILFVSGIFVLTKINSYVREMFGGLSTEVSNNFNSMINFLRK